MSIKTKNTNAYLKSYSDKLVSLLKKEMDTPQPDRQGYTNPRITNTGAARESIRWTLSRQTESELGIDIVGIDYLEEIGLNEQNKPKTVSVNDLAQWIVSKPVNYKSVRGVQSLEGLSTSTPKVQNLARLIQRKIANQGVRPTGFINRIVKEQLKNLKVVAPVVEDVKESVEDILREAGFDLKGKTIKFV